MKSARRSASASREPVRSSQSAFSGLCEVPTTCWIRDCIWVSSTHLLFSPHLPLISSTMVSTSMTPTGRPIKKDSGKCRQGRGERRTLAPRWWECKMVQCLWKTIWRFLNDSSYHMTQQFCEARMCPGDQRGLCRNSHPNVHSGVTPKSPQTENSVH